jgi:hypothetical protein
MYELDMKWEFSDDATAIEILTATVQWMQAKGYHMVAIYKALDEVQSDLREMIDSIKHANLEN